MSTTQHTPRAKQGLVQASSSSSFNFVTHPEKMKTQRIHHPTQFLSQARPSRPQLQLNHFHPYIQGDFFHWYPTISVPKIKPPSSQSRSFLVTGFTGTAAVIGLLEISFLALKLGGTSGKNHPVRHFNIILTHFSNILRHLDISAIAKVA